MKSAVINKLKQSPIPFILLYDFDDITSSEDILISIAALGFELVNFDDSISFRYFFEKNFRDKPDCNAKLILKVTGHQYIPYDIESSFYNITLSLKDLFPGLSYSILKELDSELYDRLYRVWDNRGKSLGSRETLDFILKNLFGIYPETIRNFTDLIKVLINFYYENNFLPKVVSDYFIDLMKSKKFLQEYPLGKLLEGADSFFRYLQAQWELFVESFTKTLPQKSTVDFSHKEIKMYLGSLFEEGYLTPVRGMEINNIPSWAHRGILVDELEQLKTTYYNLIDRIYDTINNITSYKDWWRAAKDWAEILIIYNDEKVQGRLDEKAFISTSKMLNDKFRDWLFSNYNLLASLSYARSPIMVHHIPWYISRQMERDFRKKVALIVFDGMALDDWFIISHYLNQNSCYYIEEKLCFAWIPTITSISRQAIFSGQIPRYFGKTIFSTGEDERHWKKFWTQQGTKPDAIYYLRNIKHFTEEGLKDIIENPRAKVLGFVVNMVDDMAHGQQMLRAGLHQNLRLW
ncbi:MAG: BREX-3 system phosphatase PglZ, partial [Thermoanaerobacteraceae bacterium]|nr:BREX-3 system phosphatase PglZ [Thermoanaerobacteraceae bacterium]